MEGRNPRMPDGSAADNEPEGMEDGGGTAGTENVFGFHGRFLVIKGSVFRKEKWDEETWRRALSAQRRRRGMRHFRLLYLAAGALHSSMRSFFETITFYR
jgi:hypothetical protein